MPGYRFDLVYACCQRQSQESGPRCADTSFVSWNRSGLDRLLFYSIDSTRGRMERGRGAYGPATGATIIGVDVGAGEPDSGSRVTATAPMVPTSRGPERMCIAVPPCDWNNPAGRGAPLLGITHI